MPQCHRARSGRCRTLCVVVFAALVASVAAEEEVASRVAVAISATLLGSMIFQMGLFYLTNHSDEDMRRYSYEIINATVSIFAAVLLFQTCNDLVETYLLDGTSPEYQVMVDMGHMLVWYCILQFTLAWISGAIGGTPESIESVELNMKTFAVLLAHMTGFASINAWGALQQLEFFKLTPIFSFLVLPISACGQFGLQRITDYIRWRIAMADDGEEDEFEKAWDDEAEEAEDDVMSLALSFNFTQAVRFTINGILPNQEGEEEPYALENHTSTQIRMLLGVGLGCATVMVILFMRQPSHDEEGKEEHAAGTNHQGGEEHSVSQNGHEGDAGHGQSHEGGHAGHSDGEEEQAEGGMSHELKERIGEVAIITTSMCFAWCTFFALRMGLASSTFFDLRDPMTLAVAVTLTISLASFSSIRVLDLIADADWTDDRVDDAIKQFIKAIGILVGFGWEQCFDQAVGSLSSRAPNPHIAKMVLALFCVAIVVPAWKWFILPMAVRDGWKFGFVVNDEEEEKWEMIFNNMQEKKKKKQEEEEGSATDVYQQLADGPVKESSKEPAKVPVASGTELQALQRAQRAEAALLATQAEAEALKEQIRGLSRQVWGNRPPGWNSPSRSQISHKSNPSNVVTPTGSTHSSMWNRAAVVDGERVAVDPV